MTDFTKDELTTLAVAIDMLVRSEGNAMGQAGAKGLSDGRSMVLANRLVIAMNAHAKIERMMAEIDAVPEPEMAPEPDALNAGGLN